MRVSQFPLNTVKEMPADAEIPSHQLMLRAGMIRKLASGLYNWMPLGLRVLRKVEHIIRQEMEQAGAIELLMPVVQPAELWQESGRWQQYGGELLRLKDRHQREFCLGPTHEEIITDIARHELRSYKQLPITYYQIQTKFRDETRPRFGVMRAREFIMKDAYSFHVDKDSLDHTYQQMYAAYCAIFERCGMEYRAVQADTGSIGGDASHEFHVIADTGEDAIAFSTSSSYAANIELAECILANENRPAATQDMTLVDTPNAKTIDELVEQFKQPIEQTVKTLIVMADEESAHQLVALLIRGDHELNELKAEKHPLVAAPLMFANEQDIQDKIGAGIGSLGPVGLTIPVIADRAVGILADFSAGANKEGQHYFGINWQRDCELPEIADLRNIQEGDLSPDGEGTITIARGIEVGHIFQLGTKYTEALNATILNDQGKAQVLTMGCYGIGVSRIVAAAIEQHHDDKGIIWPAAIAPFEVILLPMQMKKSAEVKAATEKLYADLKAAGIDVLLDDRDARAGIMFADAELIGFPHRIVIGARSLKENMIEYRGRTDHENTMIPITDIIEKIKTATSYIECK